ncbi:MAG: endonuclease/exonuclease/phosphatase family protein [Chthoniobacterales bacterium]
MKSRVYYSLGATVALAIGGALLAQTSTTPLASKDSAAGAKQTTVAFWNIRWFPGGRPNAYRGEEQKQIRAVHADIVKLNADVIGFEEVRDWENAALAIQPLPEFKVDVCSTFPPREGQTETQNVAIVSRLDAMSAWFEMWKPGAAITPPRGFAFAAYQLAPKQLLLVYALHLKSNRGELTEDIAIREESARQLSDHMLAMNKAYSPLGAITWIVGGDFNTAPDDSRYQAEKTTKTLVSLGLKWCWENIPLANRITLPPDKRFPAACFDHVYYRGATLRKAEVIPTAEASSDHRAVRAEFTLP